MASREGIQVQPWFNKKEWQEVASKIYSDDVDEQKWGIDMITVWEQRAGSSLDRSIKITADLVAATLEHENMDPEEVADKYSHLQCLYCMALIRFINYICHKYPGNLPVDEALAQAGLPASLASLHHDANHNDLPKLDLLCSSVHSSLDWLHEHYWLPQENCMEDFVPVQSQDYSGLLNNYQRAAYEMLVMKQGNDNLTAILSRLKELMVKKDNYKLFEMLASPGHLLPPSYYITTLEQAKGEGYVASVDHPSELPALARALWKPLLVLINKQRLLQILVESLLLGQSRFSPLADRMIISWVTYLLTLESTSLGWIIPVWDWQPLLKCALTSPCKYILEILPVLLENQDPPMPEEKKESVVALTAVYLGALTDYSIRDISDDHMYTYKDLEAMEHGKQLEKDPNSNPGIWSLYKGPDSLQPLPLGSYIVEQVPDEPHIPVKAELSSMVSPMAQPLRPLQQHLPLDDPDMKVKPCSPSLLAAVELYLNRTLLI